MWPARRPGVAPRVHAFRDQPAEPARAALDGEPRRPRRPSCSSRGARSNATAEAARSATVLAERSRRPSPGILGLRWPEARLAGVLGERRVEPGRSSGARGYSVTIRQRAASPGRLPSRSVNRRRAAARLRGETKYDHAVARFTTDFSAAGGVACGRDPRAAARRWSPRGIEGGADVAGSARAASRTRRSRRAVLLRRGPLAPTAGGGLCRRFARKSRGRRLAGLPSNVTVRRSGPRDRRVRCRRVGATAAFRPTRGSTAYGRS